MRAVLAAPTDAPTETVLCDHSWAIRMKPKSERKDKAKERSIIVNLRKCVTCKTERLQQEMIRLTVDYRTNEVHFNQPGKHLKAPPLGRSAYLCRSQQCLQTALKGSRLKFALEGRRVKDMPGKRSIRWPLEPQLIKLISSNCTEP